MNSAFWKILPLVKYENFQSKYHLIIWIERELNGESSVYACVQLFREKLKTSSGASSFKFYDFHINLLNCGDISIKYHITGGRTDLAYIKHTTAI